MVERAFWVPEFRFTEDQRDTLRAALPPTNDNGASFLARVEYQARLYLAERRNLRRRHAPRPKEVRESLKDLEKLARQLATKIEKLDPLGDDTAVTSALGLMRQPIDFLEDLQHKLATLQVAAGAAIRLAPAPRGGHPAKDHDIGFIAMLASEYERLYGELPPATRGCWFCVFVDQLLGALSDANSGDGPEHYRLVGSALRRIRLARERL